MCQILLLGVGKSCLIITITTLWGRHYYYFRCGNLKLRRVKVACQIHMQSIICWKVNSLYIYIYTHMDTCAQTYMWLLYCILWNSRKHIKDSALPFFFLRREDLANCRFLILSHSFTIIKNINSFLSSQPLELVDTWFEVFSSLGVVVICMNKTPWYAVMRL